jgi:ribosomal protein L11 methyltransferase
MPSWKLTLPCTRAEAEALNGDIAPLALMDPPPAIITREPDEARPDRWQLDAYFEARPDAASIALIQSLLPSARGARATIERLPDEDWVTLSQQGQEPVRAGRFFVHPSHYAGPFPNDAVRFSIDASRAFGTGGHETTAGCLAMLDGLKRRGHRFDDIADIGTGTGLLAFAANRLWPRAYVTASDIDPVSIEITRDNAAANGVAIGQRQGEVALCVAPGTDHPAIARRAPYDLIVANILAGPLIELAPAIAALLTPGGSLVLAGLLNTQSEAVARTYRAQGLRLAGRRDEGNWPALHLRKRQRLGWQRPVRASGRTSQPPGDFGTW